ncbi:hypothetical protein [Streptomyces phaeochromogenes]
MTLLYALASIGEAKAAWWGYTGSGTPLVAWWWVLLPLLLGSFLVRAVTGGPPRVRQLLPLAVVPGAIPLIPALLLAVTGRAAAPLLPIGVAAAVTALSTVVLKGGVLGATGRRWVATAATGLWVVALSVGPGTGLPNDDGPDTWKWVNCIVAAALPWGWTALLWPVLMMCAWRRWAAAVFIAALWSALTVAPEIGNGAHSWIRQEDGSWTEFGVYAVVAANRPLLAIQTVLVCGALLYLSRRGRTYGKWPPHLHTVAAGLGVVAVATAVTKFNFVSFSNDDAQRSGRYLAVAIAVVGFVLVLPHAGKARAARLHAVPPRAHNSRIHALLKNQTLEASRREFLTTSRTALAEGGLTVREWSARWKALGALGPRGKAPQQSVALRLAAELDDGLEVWIYALRWSLYGFVYGFAYSLVRGGTPLGKAMCLLAVVLPAELTQLLYRSLEPDDFGISLRLTTGDCLAVFLVLGLYWEARLVRAAGLRWGQIRNFRSLSAVAVPATTVLVAVAVATALATAMVGVWVVPGSGAAVEPPTDRPSATASRDPGP